MPNDDKYLIATVANMRKCVEAYNNVVMIDPSTGVQYSADPYDYSFLFGDDEPIPSAYYHEVPCYLAIHIPETSAPISANNFGD